MNSLLRKTRFYTALYTTRGGFRRAAFEEVSKMPIAPDQRCRPGLRIHFWAPQRTPGASVIIHDMMPALLEEAGIAGLDWCIEAGPELPREAVDWLVCFKAVPDAAQIVGNPRKVFLICDQPECFWGRLGAFDYVVATASRPLAALMTQAHPHVAFIGESEPPEHLDFGAKNLSTPPAQRGNVLLWHGGAYSLGPLRDLRPGLERLAETRDIQLHVISGPNPPAEEHWGKLLVKYFPWAKARLFASAVQARLGFVPARSSVRNSWLKPASRVRCLYSLGVPAIGDGRVPDAAEFLGEFAGPVANSAGSWARQVTELWDSPGKLQQLAVAGHAAVAKRHSTRQAARQWVRYFLQAS